MTFTVVHIKSSKPKTDYHIRAVIKKVANDTVKPNAHPYDQQRPGLKPLAFAEYVLAEEGAISRARGVDFVNGKYATPLMKLREANLVLKRLGLRQITGSPAWLM